MTSILQMFDWKGQFSFSTYVLWLAKERGKEAEAELTRILDECINEAKEESIRMGPQRKKRGSN